MLRTLAFSVLLVLGMTALSAQTDYLARARALHKTSLLIDGHNDYHGLFASTIPRATSTSSTSGNRSRRS